MKANEIQIGDWIHYQANLGEDGVYEKDIQVKNIYGNEINCEVRLYEIISGKRLCSCKPIPLTPEILEKNGFRIIFDGELHVSYFQDIESFHTEVNVDKIGIYQKLSMLDGLGNRVTIVECKYVHQLQHALRLCGIKKEIIL